MALLDRSKLLKKEKLKIEKVFLNDKDYVFVRQMTAKERDRLEQSMFIKKKGKGRLELEQTLDNFKSKLAVQTVCDQDGNLILNDDDFKILSENMSAYTLEKIINAAQSINNISDEDKDGLVKN